MTRGAPGPRVPRCGAPTRSGVPCRRPASHAHRGWLRCAYHGTPERLPTPARWTWTPARLFRLMALLEDGTGDAEIGAELGCSAEAASLARKRHGIEPRSAGTLSASEVAREIGVRCSNTVGRWLERGWMRGRRGWVQGTSRVWMVRREDLLSFLDDDRFWHLWQPERIADPWLRRHYLGERRGLRFFTLGECAAACGVECTTVAQWVTKGWLRCAANGNRLVRSDWLDEFRRGWSYGVGWRASA